MCKPKRNSGQKLALSFISLVRKYKTCLPGHSFLGDSKGTSISARDTELAQILQLTPEFKRLLKKDMEALQNEFLRN